MAHKRSEYIKGNVSHADYYGQFVSGYVMSTVVARIGADLLLKCDNLSEIPLKEWDRLRPTIMNTCGHAIIEAGDDGAGVSLSDCVCVAKRAAEMWKETT